MFASPYSSNVILAKARAMYGSSLKAHNFIDMLGFHSVSEVAAYLKNNTAYATVLRDINESTIHRGHLEALLHRKLYNDYASLSRYDLSVGMQLSEYLIFRQDIEQVVSCLRMLSAGRAEEFYFSTPLFFSSHSRLDLAKMGRVKSYAELLEALDGTPYVSSLAQFPPGEDGRIRLTNIENALTARLVDILLAIIGRTSGQLKEQLTDLYGAQVDAQNVTRILRLKKYFGADPDTIRSVLLPYGHGVSCKLMEQMIDADTAEEIMALYLRTPAGKKIPENQRSFVHDLHHRAPYFSARHYMHYSIYPMVVMLSYIILIDIEVDDIINIIEGIRYGLPPEEIKPMLVLIDH